MSLLFTFYSPSGLLSSKSMSSFWFYTFQANLSLNSITSIRSLRMFRLCKNRKFKGNIIECYRFLRSIRTMMRRWFVRKRSRKRSYNFDSTWICFISLLRLCKDSVKMKKNVYCIFFATQTRFCVFFLYPMLCQPAVTSGGSFSP